MSHYIFYYCHLRLSVRNFVLSSATLTCTRASDQINGAPRHYIKIYANGQCYPTFAIVSLSR